VVPTGSTPCFPPPVGRLALASGTRTKAAYRNVVACLDRLAERGRLRDAEPHDAEHPGDVRRVRGNAAEG
jgi:hypothetical protein